MKIEKGMKCKQTKVLGNFDFVGEEFEVTEVNDNVIILKCYSQGVGFGIEPEKFGEYFELVDDGIEENSKIKIGKKYRVIKNRETFYGRCGDIIDNEGQEVEVYNINGKDIYIKDSKNSTHVCEVINLEENSKSINTEKINKVYTYTALPFKVNWEITHNGEVTHETVDSEKIFYKVITNGSTTIVILDDESKGIAKCLPNDEYDINKGVEIASTKALIKHYQKKLKKLVK
jgi:hypothetical protein